MPTNLRPGRTTWVGRARELDALESLLHAPLPRLVTLTGPAGIGKTRLATELARRLAGRFDGGAWITDVSDCSHAAAALHAMGRQLELPACPPGVPPEARVARQLGARGPLLLVIDNFESVTAGGEDLLGTLLDLAPNVRLVVTSRRVTGVVGEHRFVVEPLQLADAVALLRERARAAGATSIDAALDDALADVVTVVDRIPLAIELAASRTRVLSPAALAAELRSNLSALSTDSQAVATRHRTLDAALEGSWAQLPAPARACLRQCAVFRGGFDLGAARHVVEPHAGSDVLERLGVLEASSLLVVAGEADAQAPRFDLLTCVRRFAEDKPGPGASRADAEGRHAEHYLSLAEAAVADAQHGRQTEDVLGREEANLLAVCERFMEADPVRAGRAVVALSSAYRQRRSPADWTALLDDAIERLGKRAASTLRCDLLLARAEARAGGPADPRALEAATASVEMATALGDEPRRIAALVRRSQLRLYAGRVSESEHDALAAVRAAGREQPAASSGQASLALGAVRAVQGELAAAATLFDQAVTAFAGVGDRGLEGRARSNLALALLESGRSEEAVAQLRRTLELSRAVGDSWAEAVAHTRLGVAALDLGDHQEALRATQRSIELHRQTGDVFYEAVSSCNLALLAVAGGVPRTAGAAVQRLRDQLERDEVAASIAWLAWCCVGAWLATGDDVAGAESAFARARRAGAESRPVARLWEATLDLARARAAPAAEAESWRAEADRKLQDVLASHGGAVESLRGHDLRVAARVVQAALRGATARTARPEPPSAAPALHVHVEAAWFRPPGAPTADIRRRRSLRRLLLLLVDRHRLAPGQAVPVRDLLSTGWAGERLSGRPALNRVHVAIRTLRRLGLSSVLRTEGEGYLLDPAIPVRLVDGPPPPDA